MGRVRRKESVRELASGRPFKNSDREASAYLERGCHCNIEAHEKVTTPQSS
jgi:hypothetical protein